LHTITVRDVILSIHGLREKDMYNLHIARRSAYVIMCSGFNSKAVSKFDKLWPEKDKKDKPVLDRALDQLRKMREYDIKQKLKQSKNA
jgi:hypothetical protein